MFGKKKECNYFEKRALYRISMFAPFLDVIKTISPEQVLMKVFVLGSAERLVSFYLDKIQEAEEKNGGYHATPELNQIISDPETSGMSFVHWFVDIETMPGFIPQCMEDEKTKLGKKIAATVDMYKVHQEANASHIVTPGGR